MPLPVVPAALGGRHARGGPPPLVRPLTHLPNIFQLLLDLNEWRRRADHSSSMLISSILIRISLGTFAVRPLSSTPTSQLRLATPAVRWCRGVRKRDLFGLLNPIPSVLLGTIHKGSPQKFGNILPHPPCSQINAAEPPTHGFKFCPSPPPSVWMSFMNVPLSGRCSSASRRPGSLPSSDATTFHSSSATTA